MCVCRLCACVCVSVHACACVHAVCEHLELGLPTLFAMGRSAWAGVGGGLFCFKSGKPTIHSNLTHSLAVKARFKIGALSSVPDAQ